MSAWIYITGLVVLLIIGLCIFMRGADERRPLPQPEPLIPSIERAAQLALDHYDAEFRAGGEPHYPQWAEDTLRGKQ